MPPKLCPICGAPDATCAPTSAPGASVTVTIAGQPESREAIEEKARTARNKARKVAANK